MARRWSTQYLIHSQCFVIVCHLSISGYLALSALVLASEHQPQPSVYIDDFGLY